MSDFAKTRAGIIAYREEANKIANEIAENRDELEELFYSIRADVSLWLSQGSNLMHARRCILAAQDACERAVGGVKASTVTRSRVLFRRALDAGFVGSVTGVVGLFFPSVDRPLTATVTGVSLLTGYMGKKWLKRKKIEAEEERRYALNNFEMTVSDQDTLLDSHTVISDASARISEIGKRLGHSKKALEKCKSTLLRCLGRGGAVPKSVREIGVRNKEAQKHLDEACGALNLAFRSLQNVIDSIGVS